MTEFTVAIPWRPSGDPHRSRVLEWIQDRYLALFPEAEVILGDAKQHEPFNRGASRNVAVDAAETEWVLIADADTVPTREGVDEAFAFLEENPTRYAHPYKTYFALKEEPTEILLSVPPSMYVPTPALTQCLFYMESWAGLIMMHKNTFADIGGYDERFVGWGYEDTAFRDVARTLAGDPFRATSHAIHLWHPPPAQWDKFEGDGKFANNRALHGEYVQRKGDELAMLSYLYERDSP